MRDIFRNRLLTHGQPVGLPGCKARQNKISHIGLHVSIEEYAPTLV